MHKLAVFGFALAFALIVAAPSSSQDHSEWLSNLPKEKAYVQKRASSYERSGANFDLRRLPAGETLTLLDDSGPGIITHIWITLTGDNPDNLKALVLRMYWDGEASPSVDAPLGDFFGLGLGEYFLYNSIPLAVGPDRALNCFFSMPFNKSARITLTNEGDRQVHAVFFNIDYQAYSHTLPSDVFYFHAQYRQAAPASLLNSPELRFVCEDVRSGVDEGQNRPGHEVWGGRVRRRYLRERILNKAPQDQRVGVELGSKERDQLLLTAKATSRNKF